MVVVPNAITFWMIDSVGPDLSGTVYIKHSRDWWSIPPKTHCWGSTQPWWFFLQEKSNSSTSTTLPGPSITMGWARWPLLRSCSCQWRLSFGYRVHARKMKRKSSFSTSCAKIKRLFYKTGFNIQAKCFFVDRFLCGSHGHYISTCLLSSDEGSMS